MEGTRARTAARPPDPPRLIHKEDPDLFRPVEQRRPRPGNRSLGAHVIPLRWPGWRAPWHRIGSGNSVGRDHHDRISSMKYRNLSEARQEHGSVCGYVGTSGTLLLRNPGAWRGCRRHLEDPPGRSEFLPTRQLMPDHKRKAWSAELRADPLPTAVPAVTDCDLLEIISPSHRPRVTRTVAHLRVRPASVVLGFTVVAHDQVEWIGQSPHPGRHVLPFILVGGILKHVRTLAVE